MTPLSLPVRVLITWLGIFPLVLIAQWLLAPVTADWPLVFSTALTLGVVVPIAVGVVIPALFRVAVAVAVRAGGRKARA